METLATANLLVMGCGSCASIGDRGTAFTTPLTVSALFCFAMVVISARRQWTLQGQLVVGTNGKKGVLYEN